MRRSRPYLPTYLEFLAMADVAVRNVTLTRWEVEWIKGAIWHGLRLVTIDPYRGTSEARLEALLEKLEPREPPVVTGPADDSNSSSAAR
jgi:nitrate reductase assembly molybdenum cofactor insertion protein NarJ